MEILATIVMLAWIPAVLIMFAVLPPQRAVIVAFLSAWLFLPVVTYPLPHLPDYTKMSATCAGIFLGALLFDAKRLLRFSPSVVDLPVAIYCLTPFMSSMSNELGAWDGVSAVMNHFVTWGLPYLIGRIYFTDAKILRELAIGVFIGGLLYVPLCLFEIRMSPILHKMVYGFAARESQMRFGGWRPNVFMDHGLQVGLWMTASTLGGIWLWWTGAMKKLWGMPASVLVLTLLTTTVLCRSMEALVLLAGGLGALCWTHYGRNRLALIGIILIAPAYIAVRTTGAWHAEQVIEIANEINQSRAESIQFRIKNEDILVARALQQPAFGWGGWGRSRVRDQWDRDISITDGRWVIELGLHGLIGMSCCFGMMLTPLTFLIIRFPMRRLLSRETAPALVLAVLVVLYAIDGLPNSMTNPVYMLIGGAVLRFARSPQKGRDSATRDISQEVDATAESIPLRRLHPGSV